jgi:hypothetical protein
MTDTLHQEAPGFMIVCLNGRRFFVETENWPEERGQYIIVEGNKVYELHVLPSGDNQIQCTSQKLDKTPFKTTWIKIPVSAIASIEKIGADSFVWQSVMKAKSNLVLPGSPVSNIRDIQGRQKFGKVK